MQPMSATAFASPAAAVCGAELTFETLTGASGAWVRVRPDEVLLRVVCGRVRVEVDGKIWEVPLEGEARIPAGVSHRLASADGRAARVAQQFRATA